MLTARWWAVALPLVVAVAGCGGSEEDLAGPPEEMDGPVVEVREGRGMVVVPWDRDVVETVCVDIDERYFQGEMRGWAIGGLDDLYYFLDEEWGRYHEAYLDPPDREEGRDYADITQIQLHEDAPLPVQQPGFSPIADGLQAEVLCSDPWDDLEDPGLTAACVDHRVLEPGRIEITYHWSVEIIDSGCDAKLRGQIVGSGTGATYGGSGWLYTGADVVGTLLFEATGREPLVISISGEQAPPDSIFRGGALEAATDPLDAPFWAAAAHDMESLIDWVE